MTTTTMNFKPNLIKKELQRKKLKNEIQRGVADLLKVIQSRCAEMLGEARALVLRYGDNNMNTVRRLRELVDEIHSTNQSLQSLNRLPPLSTLSEILDEDVTARAFQFLDEETLHIASTVSRAFRTALTPRLRKVNLGSFKSFEDFSLRNFVGIVSFSARDCDLLTDSALELLAHDYPKLAYVDMSGCRNITMDGATQFIHVIGPRLKGLSLDFVHPDYDSDEAIHLFHDVLSQSTSLESLSLTISCMKNHKMPLDGLANLKELKELSLTLDSRVTLPMRLPKLEILELEIIDEIPGYLWELLSDCHYPRMKHLSITLSSYAIPSFVFWIESLTRALDDKVANLKFLTVNRWKRISPLNDSTDFKKRPDFVDILSGIPVLQPEEKEEERTQLLSFASHNPHIRCDLSL